MLWVKIYLIACIMYWQFMENLSKLLSKLKTLTVGQKCVHRDSSCSSSSLHFGCDSNGIQNCNASVFQTPQCKCKWKTSNLILYSGIKKKGLFSFIKVYSLFFFSIVFSKVYISTDISEISTFIPYNLKLLWTEHRNLPSNKSHFMVQKWNCKEYRYLLVLRVCVCFATSHKAAFLHAIKYLVYKKG